MEGDLITLDTATSAVDWLIAETHCSEHAAQQAVRYVAAQQAAVQVVPTQTTVVWERFFDDTGGMQLVVHAPFGARINKAWGWAMRKRFCRSFDFELQATADDDGFILSLGPQHSFPIESLFPMLRPDNCQNLLEQALLITPTFHLRWRWNASRALQLERMRNGKKVPPALQRFRSQDLLTAVFPKLTGCQEEHTGDHEIPDHPLVQQTMHDCLHEALDIDALKDLLGRVERGEITFVARDVREPSPFAYELLNANPYAFLDGGEVQERRTRMAETQRTLTIESVRDLGKLDPGAIATVVDEAQPLIRDADELHDVLLSRYLLPLRNGPGSSDEGPATTTLCALETQLATLDPQPWTPLFADLVAAGRATEVEYLPGRRGWVATERWPAVRMLFPEAIGRPAVPLLEGEPLPAEPSAVRVSIVRGLMESAGPVTPGEISSLTGIGESAVLAALEALEGEGCVLRGTFREWSRAEGRGARDRAASSQDQTARRSDGENGGHAGLSRFGPPPGHCNADTATVTAPDPRPSSLDPHPAPEWCHRRLLQRIHRLTISGLRQEIQPVDVATYFRFLLQHHGITADAHREGVNGLYESIAQLQGLDIPAAAWEREVLPSRVAEYRPGWLDELCLTGEVGWGRLYPPRRDPDKSRPLASITRVAPVSLYLREDLDWLSDSAAEVDVESLSSVGRQVLDLLRQRGAMFATDILAAAQLLPAQLDDVLGELVTRGLVTSDGFAGLRGLVREGEQAGDDSGRRRGPKLVRRRRSVATTGRWSLWRNGVQSPVSSVQSTAVEVRSVQALNFGLSALDSWAWQLLRRWGVVFRDLLEKEPGAPPWWRLVPVLRRMEMRGEVRGGRFIVGVGGEQYAGGEAVQRLRTLRTASPEEGARGEHKLTILSAADPLNLIGIITPHARVPSLTGHRIAFDRGRPVADVQAGKLTVYPECPGTMRETVTAALAPWVEPCPTGAASVESAAAELPLEDRHARRFARRKRTPPEPNPRPPRPYIS